MPPTVRTKQILRHQSFDYFKALRLPPACFGDAPSKYLRIADIKVLVVIFTTVFPCALTCVYSLPRQRTVRKQIDSTIPKSRNLAKGQLV